MSTSQKRGDMRLGGVRPGKVWEVEVWRGRRGELWCVRVRFGRVWQCVEWLGSVNNTSKGDDKTRG